MSTTAEELRRRLQQGRNAATPENLRNRLARSQPPQQPLGIDPNTGQQDPSLAAVDQLMAQAPPQSEGGGIASRLRSATVPLPEREAGAGGAIARGAASSFVNSILGLPDLALTAGTRMLTGEPLVDREIEGVDPALNQRSPLPQVGERVLPMPAADDVVAGAEAAGRSLRDVPRVALGTGARILAGEPVVDRQIEGVDPALNQRPPLPSVSDMGGEFRQAQERQQQARQQGGAFGAGEVVGDIATLMTGRMPVARALTRGSRRSANITDKTVADALEAIGRSNPELAPRVAELIGSARLATPRASRLWTRLKDAEATRSVARGAGKTVETGLEGAVLGILQENDPLEVAGMAAGGQALTSALGATLGVPASLKGLAWRAVGYTVLFRTMQEFGPGENNTFEATDTAFDKMKWGLTIGVASQVVGGRFRGSRSGRQFAEDVPELADAINAVPRGAMLSVANRIQSERERGETTSIEILETLQRNPEAFGRSAARRLNRALRDGTWDKEIDKLMENRDFRRRLDELE